METYKTIIGAGYTAKKSIVTTIYPVKKTTIGGSYTPFVTVIVRETAGGAALSGNISSAVTFAGILKVTKLLSGDIAASTTWTGTLKTRLQLSGNIAADTVWSGTLSVGGVAPAQLVGDIPAAVTFAGLLKTRAQLAGNIAADVNFDSTLSIGVYPAQLVGDIAAAVTFAGTLKTKAQLTGNIAADAAFASTLKTKAQLSGNISADADFASTLSIASGGYHALTDPAMTAKGIPDDSTVYYSGTAEEITGHEMWLAMDALLQGIDDSGILPKTVSGQSGSGGNTQGHQVNVIDPGTFDRTWSTYGTGAAVIHDKLGWKHTGTSNNDGSYGYNGVIPSTHNIVAFAIYFGPGGTRDNSIDFGCAQSGGKALEFRIMNDEAAALIIVGGNENQTDNFISLEGTHYGERVSSSQTRYYNEGVLKGDFTSDTLVALPNTQIYDGAYNIWDAFPSNFGTQNFRQLFLFDEVLTDQQKIDISDLFTAFEIDMHR